MLRQNARFPGQLAGWMYNLYQPIFLNYKSVPDYELPEENGWNEAKRAPQNPDPVSEADFCLQFLKRDPEDCCCLVPAILQSDLMRDWTLFLIEMITVQKWRFYRE
jgi:hypothetical protein